MLLINVDIFSNDLGLSSDFLQFVQIRRIWLIYGLCSWSSQKKIISKQLWNVLQNEPYIQKAYKC